MTNRRLKEKLFLLIAMQMCRTCSGVNHRILSDYEPNAVEQRYFDELDMPTREADMSHVADDTDGHTPARPDHSSRATGDAMAYIMDALIDRANRKPERKVVRTNGLNMDQTKQLTGNILEHHELDDGEDSKKHRKNQALGRTQARQRFWKILRDIQQEPSIADGLIAKRHPPPPPGFHAIRGKRN